MFVADNMLLISGKNFVSSAKTKKVVNILKCTSCQGALCRQPSITCYSVKQSTDSLFNWSVKFNQLLNCWPYVPVTAYTQQSTNVGSVHQPDKNSTHQIFCSQQKLHPHMLLQLNGGAELSNFLKINNLRNGEIYCIHTFLTQ